jgi:hypothetical protein
VRYGNVYCFSFFIFICEYAAIVHHFQGSGFADKFDILVPEQRAGQKPHFR